MKGEFTAIIEIAGRPLAATVPLMNGHRRPRSLLRSPVDGYRIRGMSRNYMVVNKPAGSVDIMEVWPEAVPNSLLRSWCGS